MLIAKPKDSRGEWPLGRVMETYPGDDAWLVRVAEVQSKNNYIKRILDRYIVCAPSSISKNSRTVMTLK